MEKREAAIVPTQHILHQAIQITSMNIKFEENGNKDAVIAAPVGMHPDSMYAAVPWYGKVHCGVHLIICV